jgi:hypothetical protein
MATAPPAPTPASRTRWNGWVLTGLFLIVAALVFLLCYVSFPANSHYTGLILIGILALLFALGCYLMEAFSRQPTAQRSLAWGFFGMGFAVLFLSIGLGPSYGAISTTYSLIGLIVVLVVLIVTVALIGWRIRAVQATENQQIPREAWRNEPAPSAFSYAAANSPSVPSTAPAAVPPASNSPSNPPRSP